MPAEPKPNPYHDPLRTYVETVIDEAGFGDLEPAMRADVSSALMHEAERRVGLELISSSDTRTLSEFQRLSQGGATDEELAAFFAVRIPDLRERVAAALSDFGRECRREAETFSRGNG